VAVIGSLLAWWGPNKTDNTRSACTRMPPFG
jgi:hypothetical protein